MKQLPGRTHNGFCLILLYREEDIIGQDFSGTFKCGGCDRRRDIERRVTKETKELKEKGGDKYVSKCGKYVLCEEGSVAWIRDEGQ